MSASMPQSFNAGLASPMKVGDGNDIKDKSAGSGFRASAFVESERCRELDRRGQYYACTQHDWKGYDFDGRVMQAGRPYSQPLLSAEAAPFYVPLRLRRPASPYRLARVIVRQFTSFLFGENRWPSIRVAGDQDTQDFAEALVKAASMPVKFLRARNIGGSTGTVGISWCYHEGVPRVDVHEGKHCYIHEWASRDDLIPAHVTEVYKYSKDEYDPVKKVVNRNWYWFRRDFTKDADIYFVDQPVKQVTGKVQEPEWVVDQERSYEHNDGKCHFIWIQNCATDEVDGHPDYEGLYENFDIVDILHSVLARGTILNCDPTLVLKMDMDFVQRMGIKKGSDNALTVGTDGSAEYLELGGSALTAGITLFDKTRANVLEVAQCVVPDPATMAASGTSSLAMKLVYAPTIARGEEFREQYGAAFKRLIEDMVAVAQKMYDEPIIVTDDTDGSESPGQYIIHLPPKVISEPVLDEDGKPTGEETATLKERIPGKGTSFELQWGPWFNPTATDQSAMITSLNTANGMKPCMSEKTSIELMASAFGRDPAEELKRMESDKQKATDANLAMFADADGSMGGQVGAPGELPPGAAPMPGAPAPPDPIAPPKNDDEKLEGLTLTSTDIAGIVTVNEVRTLKLGLPPLTKKDGTADPDGELTVAQFKAKNAQTVATAAAADAGKAGPGVTDAPKPAPSTVPGVKGAILGELPPTQTGLQPKKKGPSNA